MKVAIIYATREGHTRRIADYLAGAFHARDLHADVFNAKETFDPELAAYGAIILAASVHISKHEPELVRFVKRHRDQLEQIPSAFISVSLSQAGVESRTRTSEQRQRAKKAIGAVMERFLRDTAWHPRWLLPVAGALPYTKYNFIIKLIMKMISKSAGGSTDTSCDHEYTDWVGLERFAAKIVDDLHP